MGFLSCEGIFPVVPFIVEDRKLAKKKQEVQLEVTVKLMRVMEK